MGKGLVIKYIYTAECSFQNQNELNNEKIEKIKKNTRDLLDSLFSLLDDKSSEYTKIKSVDNEICKGFNILKSSSFSTILVEFNEVLEFILITIQSSKSFSHYDIDSQIIKSLIPTHFNSNYTERYMP